MKTLLAYLTLLSLSLPHGVSAVTISTGEDLQKACNKAQHFSSCVAYLNVVYETVKAIAHMNGPQMKPTSVVGSCGPSAHAAAIATAASGVMTFIVRPPSGFRMCSKILDSPPL